MDAMIVGGTPTAKAMALLETPFTATRTGPVVAPDGTTASIWLVPQVVVARTPLKVTVPGAAPKFVPVIVTDVPAAPDAGLRLVMLGVTAVTLNETGLLP